jgi:hypothetical protein
MVIVAMANGSRDLSLASSHKNHAPPFDFASSAALIAARTPAGFLSFPSIGWSLMYKLGVIFIPSESPRA